MIEKKSSMHKLDAGLVIICQGQGHPVLERNQTDTTPLVQYEYAYVCWHQMLVLSLRLGNPMYRQVSNISSTLEGN